MLGLVVTDHLYRTYPDLPEGQLAQVRAAVVNAGVLAEAAAELRLGEALRLGKGEDASGGREKPSILSDAMEAVIGAVYLDGGWDGASGAGHGAAGRPDDRGRGRPGGHDFKTRLQELAARRLRGAARTTTWPPRAPTTPSGSRPRCRSAGEGCGVGEGRSKKQAEQAAARMAWRRLSEPAAPVGRRPPMRCGRRAVPTADVGRRCLSCPRSRPSGVTSTRRSSASGSSRWRSRAMRSIRRHAEQAALHREARGPQDHRRRAPGQVPAAAARGGRRPRRPPGHERPAPPGQGRGPGPRPQAHPRGVHLHPGRAAALRRPPHVRRGVRQHARGAGGRRCPSWPTSASTRSTT